MRPARFGHCAGCDLESTLLVVLKKGSVRSSGDSSASGLTRFGGRGIRSVTLNGAPHEQFVGDAIVAFFPAAEVGEGEACRAALHAAKAAQIRLAKLKAERHPRAGKIAFGVGVHFGDVVFGNAGTADRLKFGVIGRAVNEVARTQDMSKLLGHPVVVTDAVASRVNGASVPPPASVLRPVLRRFRSDYRE